VWLGSLDGSVRLTDRDGFYLYGRVASFADCREVSVPPQLAVFCPEQHPPTGPGLFKSGLPAAVRWDPRFNAPARAFAYRMILAKPGAFAAAVGRDFLMYFEPGDHRSQGQWRFPAELPRQGELRGPPGMKARFHSAEGAAGFLRDYQSVAWVHGPLMAVLVLVGVAGGALGWWLRHSRRDLAVHGALFSLAIVGLLLFPTVFAVYHFRYVIPAIPLTGPAAVFGVLAAMGARSGSTPRGEDDPPTEVRRDAETQQSAVP
jgi:hypothetical protein